MSTLRTNINNDQKSSSEDPEVNVIIGMFRFFILILLFIYGGCKQPQQMDPVKKESISQQVDSSQIEGHSNKTGNGPLLLTRFKTLAELKEVIQCEYGDSQVNIEYRCGDRVVNSILKTGVNESGFRSAKGGKFWDKVKLGLHSPYAVVNRKDLESIERLGRRRPWIHGKGDVAFYDLAETMVYHISDDDVAFMSSEDLSEKGYLNTFNHVTAQAFMTSIFSESLADFVGDVHERSRMPELITGNFTKDQLTDLEDGALDNYIDLINNEWGQEIGKLLRSKYSINRFTDWTPVLMANYLNDILRDYSWGFQIGFKPFKPTDEIVIRFAGKINNVINN